MSGRDTKFKSIPREEIDALEDLLDKILKKTGRFAYSGKERSSLKDKPSPFANISFTYGQGNDKESLRLVAQGTSKEGSYDVQLKINLPDKIYSILMQNMELETPIMARGLKKKAYSLS